jgi:NADH dehydrogenase
MTKTTDRTLAGMPVTLLGGSGFFGRNLAQQLLARGARVRLASRRPEQAWGVKPLARLGHVQFIRCDVTRPETVAPALVGSEAVVNLVGSFSGGLDALQGRGAGRIADLARAAGVKAFAHVSALGADSDSPIDYARTKAEGEDAVRAAFPEATVFRPAILFGPDDDFVMRFGALIARLPVMPVFAPQAKLQPVFVGDAAQGVAQALQDPEAHAGKVFEIVGPDVITMIEFNRRIAAEQGRKRLFVELPGGVASAFATLTGWLPGAPITRDQLALLSKGNVASGRQPGLEELGVTPRPLSLFLERWMVRFRKRGRFSEVMETPQGRPAAYGRQPDQS